MTPSRRRPVAGTDPPSAEIKFDVKGERSPCAGAYARPATVGGAGAPPLPPKRGPGQAKGGALPPPLLQVPLGAFTDTRPKAREAARVMAEKRLDG